MSKVTIKSANTGAKLEFADIGNEYFTLEYLLRSLYDLPHLYPSLATITVRGVFVV
ncbi:hypothetical protein [Scytonema sp. PCC 10023]|uniref:hypothetical protein n=1 Tax=Scytonema sp. PCC 10023 TaxID=1680591 RepID=UPI0039C69152